MTDDSPHPARPQPEQSIEDLLDWLCYIYADQGEKIHPPDETAREYVESSGAADYFTDTEVSGIVASKTTDHQGILWESQAFFKHLEDFGYSPEERARRYARRCNVAGDDMDTPTFEWRMNEDSDAESNPE